MNWINLRTETLRSADFANAKPGAIETWLRVLAYSCEQENGGRLAGAVAWTERAWLMACGVTKQEIENAKPLLFDDGVDFFIAEYPTEKEHEIKAKRKAGMEGGKKRARNAKKSETAVVKNQSKNSIASSTASNFASTEGEGEWERNGNRKEKQNGNENGNPKNLRTATQVEMPSALAGEDFEEAWKEWAEYRKQAKLKAYLPMGAQKQLAELATIGKARAIAAINHSIAQGWQGIHEPKSSGRTGHPSRADFQRPDLSKMNYEHDAFALPSKTNEPTP